MHWFYNLKLSSKLLIGFVLVALIAATIGGVGTIKLKEIDDADTKLYEKITVPLGDLSDISTSFQRIRINLREAIDPDSTAQQRKAAQENVKKLRQEIGEKSAKFEKTILTDEGRKLFDEFKKTREVYGKYIDQLEGLALAEKYKEADALIRGDMKKAAFDENEAIDKLQDSKLKQAKATSDENTVLANAATRIMIVLAVIGAILAIGLGLFISRIIMRQLGGDPKEVGEVANLVAVGDLSREIALKQGDSSSVMAAMNKMVDTIKALVADTGMLSQAAVEGKLATRADASKHQGDFRRIVTGVNETLDAVIGPLNVAGEYVDRISKGDIPPKITDEYKGDFNEIKNNLNQAIEAVNALVSDAAMLSQAAMAGCLNTRADAGKHQGDFRRIVEGVNETITRLVGFMDAMPAPAMIIDNDFSILYMNEFGAKVAGRTQTESVGKKCYDHFKTSDCRTDKCACSRALGSGNTASGETDAHPMSGVDLDISYNAVPIKDQSGKVVAAFEIVTDLTSIKKAERLSTKIANYQQMETEKLVDGLTKLSQGNTAIHIEPSAGDVETQDVRKTFQIIGDSVNTCVESINALVADANMLSQAAVEGKLATRADASKHQGDFQTIVEGVNQTLDSVIGPLNVAAEYVDRISKGDIPPKIIDSYNGDFNEIKNNLNACIDTMSGLLAETDKLVNATVAGQLATRGDAARFVGGWGQLIGGVNNLCDAFVGPINVTAEYVDRISKGDIPPKITDSYNGDFNEIKNNLNACIDTMSGLLAETDKLVNATIAGQLATRGDAARFVGGWGQLVGGVNNLCDAFVGPINVTAEYVDRISKGDIPPKITDSYNGDFNEIKNNLNACIDVMNNLLTQTDILIKGAANGELDKRADADLFVGGWKQLVSGVNDTVVNIVNPLRVTADYVDQVAKGIIPPVITDTYKGEYNVIKGNLNNMVKMMNDLLAQTDILIRAAADGELDKRADATLFVGGWNQLVKGVNDTVTNIVNPLNVTANYVDRISKGDIPPQITDNYNGDYNKIKNNLNECIEAINKLVTDAKMLSQAAVEGKLATRADASKHQGDFQAIVEGVNQTLDSVIGPLNVAAEYVDRISKGDIPPRIVDSYNGDFNEIKNNLNACIDTMSGLLAETDKLVNATVAGQLATRGDAARFVGGWGQLVGGVNNLCDAFVGPINVTAEYVDRISKGDIPPKITDSYNGDFNEIKNNLNACIDTMSGLLAETDKLVNATIAGQLATRGDAARFVGGWGQLVGGVNNLCDAFVGPINVTAEYVDRISKGDIPPKITDSYNGDFNEIKNNLNACIDVMNNLLTQTDILIKGAANGELDKRADADLFVGGWKQLVSGVNDTVVNIVNPLRVTADYVDQVAKGIIPPTITDTYKGEYNVIKGNLNNMVKMMNDLLAQTDILIRAAADGELDKRADATLFVGGWNQLVKGVNDTVTNIVNPLNVTANYVDRISKGDIPPQITDNYNGDYNKIKNNLNVLVEAMNSVTETAAQIALGNLSVEVRERSPQDQLMQALTRMVITLRELARTAEQIADGDLTVNVKPASESDAIGNAFATMVANLREIVGNVGSSSDSIATATKQIATGNADLAQRTEEQAASLEETAASMEELTSTVKQNADNSQQANQLAIDASDVAVKGGAVITRVVTTMDSISDSSKKIADIIGVIDGIAFQTNILALNAAVEAARAGEQGRGFAVVAGEVRNLAQRSAAAAKEIKALISDSVDKVGSGSKLVGEAGQTMQEIVTSIKRVTDIMAEISAASVEQSSGIEQVNTTITTMDEITQQNSSVVQQAASAADALQEQAQLLVEAVGRFKLDDTRKTGKRDVSWEQKAAAPHATSRPLKQTIPLDKVRKANGYHKTEKANGYHKTETQEAQPVMAKAVGHDAEWNEF